MPRTAPRAPPGEHHRSGRSGWLRAAVLGANDGIVSTASLVLGVAAAGSSPSAVWMAAVAGLVAGAMSMAAGEYVSVHSQSDTEAADLAQEAAELKAMPASELRELTAVYVGRGVEPALARQVAEQLTRHDALAAHAREEFGIGTATAARPLQAALASAAAFSAGAALPLAVTGLVPAPSLMVAVVVVSLLSLAAMGALAARVGGARWLPGAWRVTLWGALAMAATAAAGVLFGAGA